MQVEPEEDLEVGSIGFYKDMAAVVSSNGRLLKGSIYNCAMTIFDGRFVTSCVREEDFTHDPRAGEVVVEAVLREEAGYAGWQPCR